MVAPEQLPELARITVSIASRRGWAAYDRCGVYDEALSALGVLLAERPDATKHYLLNEAFNSVKRERRWGEVSDRVRRFWTNPATPTPEDRIIAAEDAREEILAGGPGRKFRCGALTASGPCVLLEGHKTEFHTGRKTRSEPSREQKDRKNAAEREKRRLARHG